MPELLPVILESGLRVLLALSGLLLVLFTIMTAIRVFVLPRGDNARLARLIFRLRPSSISQRTTRMRIRRGIRSEKGTVAISRETTLPGGRRNTKVFDRGQETFLRQSESDGQGLLLSTLPFPRQYQQQIFGMSCDPERPLHK